MDDIRLLFIHFPTLISTPSSPYSQLSAGFSLLADRPYPRPLEIRSPDIMKRTDLEFPKTAMGSHYRYRGSLAADSLPNHGSLKYEMRLAWLKHGDNTC